VENYSWAREEIANDSFVPRDSPGSKTGIYFFAFLKANRSRHRPIWKLGPYGSFTGEDTQVICPPFGFLRSFILLGADGFIVIIYHTLPLCHRSFRGSKINVFSWNFLPVPCLPLIGGESRKVQLIIIL